MGTLRNIVVVLHGFKRLLQGIRSGYIFSLLLAGAGVFAFAIHGYFMVTGHPEFTLPMSMGILIIAFVVSVPQGILSVKALLRHG